MPALLRRLSLVVALLSLALAWVVVVNDASGSAATSGTDSAANRAVLETPPPSGGTPGTSPFPPSAPTGLEATSVTSVSVTLRWVASAPGCCAVEGYEIMYNQAFNDIVWLQTTGNVTTVTITANLRPASQYSFRVTARDGLGHRSGGSNLVTVVTPRADTGPDTVPPGAPSDLRARTVTATSATLSWSPATDNVGVTGYEVYKFDGLFVSTLLATVSGTEFTVPLATSRNLFYVRSRDAAGNVSIATGLLGVNPSSASPSEPPSGISCRVALTGSSVWTGGFVLGLTITNTGTTPITDWTLTFFFGGDQRIISAWNATFSQSGQSVSMGHAGWNRVIAPGASTSVGSQGTWVTSSAPPTAYFINGVRCALG